MAVTVRSDNPDVFVLDLARGSSARLTFDDGEDETPIWTPDGLRVTFSADRVGKPRRIYSKLFDGSGTEEPLLDGDQHPHVNSWSPDGQTLIYTEFDPGYSGDLWVYTRGEKGEKRVWLRTQYNERAARISPDGHWVAYTSNESGRDEVYVRPFPGPGGKWQISVAGGSGPFVSTRRGDAAYDVTPDDQRFLMIQRDESSISTHLDVILNFAEELKRRVPVSSQP